MLVCIKFMLFNKLKENYKGERTHLLRQLYCLKFEKYSYSLKGIVGLYIGIKFGSGRVTYIKQ